MLMLEEMVQHRVPQVCRESGHGGGGGGSGSGRNDGGDGSVTDGKGADGQNGNSAGLGAIWNADNGVTDDDYPCHRRSGC